MEEQLDNPEIMDDESVDCDIKKEEELTLYLYYTLRYHDFIWTFNFIMVRGGG